MPAPFWIIDAFTDRPFAGNPAAIVRLEADADAGWMQAVAAEFNLSETAFVRPVTGGQSLRWFTPAAEVDLCGHATLAAAHALRGELRAPGAPVRFHTRSGLLTCRYRDDGSIDMDFPATPALEVTPPVGLLEALGVAGPAWVGRTRFDFLVALDSAAAVRALAPDFRALVAVEARGVTVTAPSDEGAFDCVSRFFAPSVGVDEDPVTGSAHCAVGPYWSARLGRAEVRAFQASRRGGSLRLTVGRERVTLSGHAVTVATGLLA